MDTTKEKFRKSIGKVTSQERDEIQLLFERKNALIELSRSLITFNKKDLDRTPLYDKIIADLGRVSTKFQKWWDEMSVKYNWKMVKNCHWQIDFETCNIYLVKVDRKKWSKIMARGERKRSAHA